MDDRKNADKFVFFSISQLAEITTLNFAYFFDCHQRNIILLLLLATTTTPSMSNKMRPRDGYVIGYSKNGSK